ncbi:uncharacterized protein [Magallana gigas]|uniref:uncharacterized protein n=1 Tax=Magallana gigas TaxID=29159 RepID=UPI003342884B
MKMSSKYIKKCMQMTTTIPILAVVCFFRRAQADSEEITSSCYAAKLQIEDRCPSTESGWIRQAKLKQCSNIVLPCQKQLTLEYHCLQNTWQNRTISATSVQNSTLEEIAYSLFMKQTVANTSPHVHSDILQWLLINV